MEEERKEASRKKMTKFENDPPLLSSIPKGFLFHHTLHVHYSTVKMYTTDDVNDCFVDISLLSRVIRGTFYSQNQGFFISNRCAINVALHT